MGRTLTSDEVEAEYIASMGKALGAQFHRLWEELAWLNIKWAEYVELLGTKPSRVDLLNKAAPLFFKIVGESLWESILLHICRITDPPKSKGNATLTVLALPKLVDSRIENKVTKLVEIVNQKTKFCRDWRHRRIAHLNLDLALKQQKTKPLDVASKSGVQEALNAIADVLNEITRHYQDASTMFAHLGDSNGAVQLLYVIDDGLKSAEERKNRRKQGIYLPEDLQRRNL